MQIRHGGGFHGGVCSLWAQWDSNESCNPRSSQRCSAPMFGSVAGRFSYVTHTQRTFPVSTTNILLDILSLRYMLQSHEEVKLQSRTAPLPGCPSSTTKLGAFRHCRLFEG